MEQPDLDALETCQQRPNPFVCKCVCVCLVMNLLCVCVCWHACACVCDREVLWATGLIHYKTEKLEFTHQRSLKGHPSTNPYPPPRFCGKDGDLQRKHWSSLLSNLNAKTNTVRHETLGSHNREYNRDPRRRTLPGGSQQALKVLRPTAAPPP